MLTLPPRSKRQHTNKECDLFRKSHLAIKITSYDVGSVVRKAYNIIAFNTKGEFEFRATSIYPLNVEVFSKKYFIGALIIQSESVIVK